MNIPNLAYSNQYINAEIPYGSKYHVFDQDIVQIIFDLDIESIDKAISIVNNVGRALMKKIVLMLGSESFDTINILKGFLLE